MLNFFSFHFVSLKEQIIFKTDLSRALSQGRLSHRGHGASGRLSAQWLQASLHSAPCVVRWGFVYRHRQLTDCMSGLQPRGLGRRLSGWGSPVGGSVLALVQSLWLCLPCFLQPSSPSSDHVELAVLPLSARGQTCVLGSV